MKGVEQSFVLDVFFFTPGDSDLKIRMYTQLNTNKSTENSVVMTIPKRRQYRWAVKIIYSLLWLKSQTAFKIETIYIFL